MDIDLLIAELVLNLPKCFWQFNNSLPLGMRRTGGHFGLIEDGPAEPKSSPLLILRVGRYPEPEKKILQFSLCQEKMIRLLDHPTHLSSHQSQDPDNERFGGAIRCCGFIFSFSSFPGFGDETLLLNLLTPNRWVGNHLIHPTDSMIDAIVAVSGNTMY